MDNIELFKYSLENEEKILDARNKKEEIVLTPTCETKNELMQKNERLINLITVYNTLNEKMTQQQEKEIIDEIDKILFCGEKMNYSAFSQYFMVWNLSHSLLKNENVENRKLIIRELLKKYIVDRHKMYNSHGYSNIVLQVLSDNYSHKRKGMSGIKHLEIMFKKAGIEKYNGKQNIESGFFYLLPDKEGKKCFLHVLSHKKISLKWSKTKQGKMPDAYIQKTNHIFIVEHKYKKEQGGGQNSQNVELVDFIKNSDKNVS